MEEEFFQSDDKLKHKDTKLELDTITNREPMEIEENWGDVIMFMFLCNESYNF